MKILLVEDITTLCAIYAQYLDCSELEATAVESLAAAIEACDGSINRAAKQLEVAPSAIYRKIQSCKSQSSSH